MRKNITKLLMAIIVTVLLLEMLGAAQWFVGATATNNTFFKGECISIGVGKTETERGFSWQTTAEQKNGAVKIVEKSRMNGKTFPADARIVNGTAIALDAESYHIKVTVDGLKPGTEYTYACGDSELDVWSTPYTFKAEDPTKGYKAIFVGDPQIGAGVTAATDGDNFEDTLYSANKIASDAAFVLCAGDQVEGPGSTNYEAVLSPSQLKKWAFVPTVGNHDWGGKTKRYYYMPNQTGLGATSDASDYYFSYGNTLYIVLNGSNSNVAEHKQAMEQAIKTHPDAVWRVVMFHEDVYGYGTHAFAPEGANYSSAYLRRTLVPIIDEFDIDLVLNGHDHYYTRSHFMKNQLPITNNHTLKDGGYLAPEGTLYITGGCSSDAKYYNVSADVPEWVDVVCTEKRKTFSVIEVTGNSLSVKTYFGDKTLEVVDEVTIYQKDPSPTTTTKPTTSTTKGSTSASSTTSSTVTSSSLNDNSTIVENTTTTTTAMTATDSVTSTLFSTTGTTAVSGNETPDDNDDGIWGWFLLAIPVGAAAIGAVVLRKRKK